MRRIPVAGRPGSNIAGLKNSCQIAVGQYTDEVEIGYALVALRCGSAKDGACSRKQRTFWGAKSKFRVNSIYQWPAGGDPSADRIPTCPILTLDPASGDGAANAPNCQLDTVPRTRSCFHTVRDRNSKVDQTKPCSTHFTLSRVDGCYTN